MAPVSGPSNPVNQPVPQQQPAAAGSAPQQSNQAAQAPAAVAPQQAQQAQTAFEGQSKRPSGEKLGAAVAGPNVPLPSMDLGGTSKAGPVSLKSSEGQKFVKEANTALAGQQQSIMP